MWNAKKKYNNYNILCYLKLKIIVNIFKSFIYYYIIIFEKYLNNI